MRDLQLNEPNEVFALFTGSKLEQMPVLLNEGRELASMKIIMEQRLRNSGKVLQNWRGKFFDTNMAALVSPDGEEVKFVLEHPLIYTLNPSMDKEVRKNDGSLPVSIEQYQAKDGFPLNKTEVSLLRSNQYALPKKRQEFWEFAAEGDLTLLKDYQTMVEEQLGTKDVMGLSPCTKKGLRLVWFCGVDDYVTSDATNYCQLHGYAGRLVGVAPEAQGARVKIEGVNIEEIVKNIDARAQDLIEPSLKTKYADIIREELKKYQ